ncbi:MAG: hypothetical protein HYX53_00940 [Chloroflexi bacterium]|nr:hypothetical protein [Chloroflexota bacterium]
MTQPLFAPFLPDTSSLINIQRLASGRRHLRDMTKLLKTGSLRISESVARELRQRDDALHTWAIRNTRYWVPDSTLDEGAIAAIARRYRPLLGERTSAADPVLVALGASHPARFIIVSDDAGVQAACLSENVPCIGYKAFLKIHALS